MFDTHIKDLEYQLTLENKNWSNAPLPVQDAFQILSRFFDSSADVIKCPNPFNSDKTEVLPILLGITHGITEVFASSEELLKPVIAVFNPPDPMLSGKKTMCVRKRCHCQLLVIIPKTYILSDGNEINNECQSIYLIDPCFPNMTLHPILKFLFKNEFSFSHFDPESNSAIEIKHGGFFKSANIIETNIIEAPLNLPSRCDCPLISIYIAIKLIKFGNHTFLNEMNPESNKEIGAKLRFIFSRYQNYKQEDIRWQDPISDALINTYINEFGQLITSLTSENLKSDQDEMENTSKIMQCNKNAMEKLANIYEAPRRCSDRMKKQPQSDLKVSKNREFKTIIKNFAEFVMEADWFVDKTLFIYHIFEHPSPLILITRPQKWGKTLNLLMLKSFLEFEKDQQAFLNKKKLFEGGIICLTNNKTKALNALKIWEIDHGIFMNEYFGKYSVIFVDFGEVLCKVCETEIDLIKNLNLVIKDAYENHSSIYENELLEVLSRYNLLLNKAHPIPTENMSRLQLYNLITTLKLPTTPIIDKFHDYLDIDYSEYKLNDFLVKIIGWLDFLIDIVSLKYKKKIWVLVDEYDQLLNVSIQTPWFNQVRNVVISLLSSLANNEKVSKAVITGTLAYKMDFPLSVINAFSRCGVLEWDFQADFGFTELEITEILIECLKDFSNYNLEKQKKHIKSLYNGYCIGNETMINPFSSLSNLNKEKPGENDQVFAYYWAYTGFHTILINYFKKLLSSADICQLLLWQTIEKDLTIFNRWISCTDITEDDPDFLNYFILLLLDTGFLTKDPKKPNLYAIPSLEVRETFYIELMQIWMMEKINGFDFSSEYWIKEIVDSIDNLNKFQTIVQSILPTFKLEKACEYDLTILLGAAINIATAMGIKANHYLFSEKAAGRKFIDAFFLPIKNRSSVAVIHEYKLIESDSEEEIEKSLENAIWQLYANKYLSAALNKHNDDPWDTVITRGIVFYRSTNNSAWNVSIKSFSHPIADARIINEKFSDLEIEGIPYKDSLNGSGKQNHVNKARSSFLKRNGKSSSISEFLMHEFKSNKRGRDTFITPQKLQRAED